MPGRFKCMWIVCNARMVLANKEVSFAQMYILGLLKHALIHMFDECFPMRTAAPLAWKEGGPQVTQYAWQDLSMDRLKQCTPWTNNCFLTLVPCAAALQAFPGLCEMQAVVDDSRVGTARS